MAPESDINGNLLVAEDTRTNGDVRVRGCGVKRRAVSLLLALPLACSLVGCGNDSIYREAYKSAYLRDFKALQQQVQGQPIALPVDLPPGYKPGPKKRFPEPGGGGWRFTYLDQHGRYLEMLINQRPQAQGCLTGFVPGGKEICKISDRLGLAFTIAFFDPRDAAATREWWSAAEFTTDIREVSWLR
jgi:hypothetical protein